MSALAADASRRRLPLSLGLPGVSASCCLSDCVMMILHVSGWSTAGAVLRAGRLPSPAGLSSCWPARPQPEPAARQLSYRLPLTLRSENLRYHPYRWYLDVYGMVMKGL